MTMDKHPTAPEASPRRKKLALGRGLGALIPEEGPEPTPAAGGELFRCAIELIRPNPFQPRRRFAEEAIAELAESIRAQGILQPLIVRRADSGYELVAGERRLRAARRAGLREVPAVLKEVSDDQLLEMSLVENIQRADLNPIEEADAYESLIRRLNLTQEEAAARVGRSRSAVANILRLRALPDPIKAAIAEGSLTMGHARALLGAESAAQQLAAFRAVAERGLSVRETEALVRRLKAQPKAPRVRPPDAEALQHARLAEELSRHLGTKVSIRHAGRHGRIEIAYYGLDDLERLLAHLRQPRRG